MSVLTYALDSMHIRFSVSTFLCFTPTVTGHQQPATTCLDKFVFVVREKCLKNVFYTPWYKLSDVITSVMGVIEMSDMIEECNI